MDLDKIEKLVSIIEKSTLTEFSIEEGEMKISMTRKGVESTNFIVTNQEEILDSLEEEIEEFITSPIVGTFYSAVSPETPAFVRVGETIKNGQPVCIVEAMKLMNEIESEVEGEIAEILVKNEEMVEYGQKLFKVRIK